MFVNIFFPIKKCLQTRFQASSHLVAYTKKPPEAIASGGSHKSMRNSDQASAASSFFANISCTTFGRFNQARRSLLCIFATISSVMPSFTRRFFWSLIRLRFSAPCFFGRTSFLFLKVLVAIVLPSCYMVIYDVFYDKSINIAVQSQISTKYGNFSQLYVRIIAGIRSTRCGGRLPAMC